VKRLRTVAVVFGAVSVVMIAAAAAFSSEPAPRAARVASSTALLRNCTGDVAATRRFAGYRYVILNAWNYRLIRRLKAETPGIKVLVYKDMATSREDTARNGVDHRFIPAGVGFAWAAKHHPDWFVTDAGGRRINWKAWPSQWQMDVGKPAYQQAWRSNVSRELKQFGWDGVLIDNVNASLQYPWILDGRTTPRYPTDADYEAATTQFLMHVAPALKKDGFLVIANMNDVTGPLWRRWLALTSGAMKEWWTKAGLDTEEGLLGGDAWAQQMELFGVAQSLGRVFLAVTYGRALDSRAMRYARASFLLGWSGGGSALIYQICGADPWSPEWSSEIGLPLGSARAVEGVWRREFTRGMVLVNPSDSSVSVQLPKTYLLLSGSPVTGIVLGPRDGLVLRRQASTRSGS
jgi:hypothetical protein